MQIQMGNICNLKCRICGSWSSSTFAVEEIEFSPIAEKKRGFHYQMLKQKLKILLAEDDLNLGLLLVDYLETEGFELKLCKDGEQALKAVESSKFDLCLLDVEHVRLRESGC